MAFQSEIPTQEPHIIRLRYILEKSGKCRSAIYDARANDPTFPPHIQLGRRAVGWSKLEIDRWIQGLIDSRGSHIEPIGCPNPRAAKKVQQPVATA